MSKDSWSNIGRPNVVMNDEQIDKACSLIRHKGSTLYDVAAELDISVECMMRNFHTKPEYIDKLLSAQDDRRTVWREQLHMISADDHKDSFVDKDGNEHERHVPSKRADIRTKCLQWDYAVKHVDVASVLSGMRKMNPMTNEEKLWRVETALIEGRIDTEAAEKILSIFERAGKIREQLVLKDRLEALEAKMSKPVVMTSGLAESLDDFTADAMAKQKQLQKQFDRVVAADPAMQKIIAESKDYNAQSNEFALKAAGKWDYVKNCPLADNECTTSSK